MTRSPVRTKLDPQAEAKPVPRVGRAKLTARMMWMTEVLQDLHARQLNLEALLARAPGVRQLLRRMPRNLKALAPMAVPFDARLWSRGEPEEQSRYATAVAWFRDHPGCSLKGVARKFGVFASNLRRLPAMRELRLGRPSTTAWHGPTGAAQRALRYLRGRRPASISEVARAVGVCITSLNHSPRFRKAWAAYARTATLDPRARRLFGRPTARRKQDRPVSARRKHFSAG
jgi:hypothetical protein